jgi:hypothetical protein
MLRVLLWALAIAFVVGFLIGSLLRRGLERPVRYVGGRSGVTTTAGDRRIVSMPPPGCVPPLVPASLGCGSRCASSRALSGASHAGMGKKRSSGISPIVVKGHADKQIIDEAIRIHPEMFSLGSLARNVAQKRRCAG